MRGLARDCLLTRAAFYHRNSNKAQQELLLDLMWSIWPELPAYGRKAAQFVDLLGYFSLKTAQTEKKVRERPSPLPTHLESFFS